MLCYVHWSVVTAILEEYIAITFRVLAC